MQEMQFPCPVCQRVFEDYDLLSQHYEPCFESQEQFLSQRKVADVKDTMFAMKLMWDEISVQVRQKREQEEATLRFLEESGSGNLVCERCEESKFFREVEQVRCCGKQFCHDCLRSYIERELDSGNVTDLKCLNTEFCVSDLSHPLLEAILGHDGLEQLEQRRLHAFMKSQPDLFIFCPNCDQGFERVEQNPDDVRRRLTSSSSPCEESDIHRERFRFSCRSCRTEFCAECRITPYHEGYTCESYTAHLGTERCRFCDETVLRPDESLAPALRCICDSEECQSKLVLACERTLECGHHCYGIRGERDCLPCLMPECVADQQLRVSNRRGRRRRRNQPAALEQEGGDYCNICFIEGLESAPCIHLQCNHVFHYQCILDKIAAGWPTAEISWTFLQCPLCKDPIAHSSRQNLLRDALSPLTELRSTVNKMSIRRLRHEGLDRDDMIVKRTGRFYKNPQGFAEFKLAYYQCFQCSKPYFGGLKSCEDVGGGREINREDLVCGTCSARTMGVTGMKTCQEHGPDFVEWKCKFCCNLSTFFCWGSTHFCDACHKIQVESQRMTKMAVEDLPRCKGGRRCPSGGNHAPNGQEFALGCSVCRRNCEF